MHRKLTLLALAASLALALPAGAGGFLIYEHNASGTGMCGARTAVADDPSAMFFNPAAITELAGVQLQFGVTGILPYSSYEPNNSLPGRSYPDGTPVNDGLNAVDAKIKGYNPIHLYATWNIFETGFHLGFGLTNPFGLGSYYPGDWDGRFIATETEIQTFLPNLAVAVDVARLAGFKDRFKLSLAAGYTLIYGQARLSKRIDLSNAYIITRGDVGGMDAEGEMRMTGDGLGHGWNLALYAEWPDILAFGFSVRGGLNPDGSMAVPFEGTANFTFNENGLLARDYLRGLGTVIPDTTMGRVKIDLPLNFNLGVAFIGIENLILAADFYLADFRSYDVLRVEFGCLEDGTCSDALDKPLEKNWGISWQVSLGAEYKLFGVWPLRVGWGTVSNPVPEDTYDPSLADGQRQLITVGTGYHWSWGKLDIGYMLAFWSGEKQNEVGSGDAGTYIFEGRANGKYSTQSHLLGLTFTAAL
jgi:long-chain fatty acid transport protein